MIMVTDVFGSFSTYKCLHTPQIDTSHIVPACGLWYNG
ncbi:hypothetical protein URH17368_0688 [Alicyclobacillus hesperidum URH17-3-68]|nr:hypothetical protein URH17368_0688 [Alicyclobacillus hesperidum URH17-3-68]